MWLPYVFIKSITIKAFTIYKSCYPWNFKVNMFDYKHILHAPIVCYIFDSGFDVLINLIIERWILAKKFKK